MTSPLQEIPLFVREGAIIPAMPVRDRIGAQPLDAGPVEVSAARREAASIFSWSSGEILLQPRLVMTVAPTSGATPRSSM